MQVKRRLLQLQLKKILLHPLPSKKKPKENSQLDEEGHDDHDEEGHDDHDEEGHDDHDEEGHDDHDEEGHDDHDEEGHDDHDEEGHDDHDEEETPATVVVYNKGEIINVTGSGSEFYKREVTY